MNENCLEGMQCPNCKSFGPFEIDVTAIATVSDNGTEDFREVDWNEDSPCWCPVCNHAGRVKTFTI